MRQQAPIVEATMKTTPKDATHWSVRTMAAAQKLGSAAVQRIWTKHKLQPHRVESFKTYLSNWALSRAIWRTRQSRAAGRIHGIYERIGTRLICKPPATPIALFRGGRLPMIQRPAWPRLDRRIPRGT